MAEQKTFTDQDNYHKLSEPFESPEAAENAFAAFWDEFYELRNKHKLPDVYVIAAIAIRYPDGETGSVMASLHAGDELRREPMVAWAYGRESALRQERLAKLIETSAAVIARKSKK